MPLYVYTCPNGHTVDLIQSVEERHNAPPCDCGAATTLEIQVSSFDPDMGLDPDFPTASDRWAKTHWKAAKGK